MPDTADVGSPEESQKAAITASGAPGFLPLLGHVHRMARDPLEWLEQCRRAGPVLRLKLGPRTTFLVTDPHLVRRVLTDSDFEKGGPLMACARNLLGNGLATCLREEHRRQRPLMQPAFTLPRIAGYTAVMREEAERLAGMWTLGCETDPMEDLSGATLRVMIRAMLPVAHADEANRIARQVRILLDGALLRAAVPFPILFKLPTPGNRRFERARSDTFAAAADIVTTTRAKPDESGLLIALIAPDGGAPDGGEAVTDEDLRDQVMTLLASGGDTTATTLAWVFHLLATHPDIERRLHEELDAVLGGEIAGYDDVPRLPFTRNVVTEALRLYPPAWMMSRVALVDVDLDGHRLPVGAEVFFSSCLLHHDPLYFPDPDSFDPDRWDRREPDELSAVASVWRFRPTPRHDVRPRPPLSMTPARLHLVPELRPGRQVGVRSVRVER